MPCITRCARTIFPPKAWPMAAMETMYDVYHDWIMPKVFELGIEVIDEAGWAGIVAAAS